MAILLSPISGRNWKVVFQFMKSKSVESTVLHDFSKANSLIWNSCTSPKIHFFQIIFYILPYKTLLHAIPNSQQKFLNLYDSFQVLNVFTSPCR